mgnify:CR=1 FL=1
MTGCVRRAPFPRTQRIAPCLRACRLTTSRPESRHGSQSSTGFYCVVTYDVSPADEVHESSVRHAIARPAKMARTRQRTSASDGPARIRGPAIWCERVNDDLSVQVVKMKTASACRGQLARVPKLARERRLSVLPELFFARRVPVSVDALITAASIFPGAEFERFQRLSPEAHGKDSNEPRPSLSGATYSALASVFTYSR